MNILILETTCDETAAAVVSDRCEVLGSAIATQDELHQRFSGVVPEIASRAHVERILPVIGRALSRASLPINEIQAVAVATTPGLAGSLLVGLSAAKALCVALEIPLIAINHLHAHVYACQLDNKATVFPSVGLIASGGHSSFFRCDSPLEFALLGGTIDDAAGEAFDKVAAMLNLAYPGGPAIERAALKGNPGAFQFPRSFIHEPERIAFSFSGVKTAVRYKIAALCGQNCQDASDAARFDASRLSDVQVADIVASFQEAIVEAIVAKSRHALRETGLNTLCVGGGVASNAALRQALSAAAEQDGFRLFIAPRELCTDNAVMGAIAVERLRGRLFEPLDADVRPGPLRA